MGTAPSSGWWTWIEGMGCAGDRARPTTSGQRWGGWGVGGFQGLGGCVEVLGFMRIRVEASWGWVRSGCMGGDWIDVMGGVLFGVCDWTIGFSVGEAER